MVTPSRRVAELLINFTHLLVINVLLINIKMLEGNYVHAYLKLNPQMTVE